MKRFWNHPRLDCPKIRVAVDLRNIVSVYVSSVCMHIYEFWFLIIVFLFVFLSGKFCFSLWKKSGLNINFYSTDLIFFFLIFHKRMYFRNRKNIKINDHHNLVINNYDNLKNYDYIIALMISYLKIIFLA